jgi:eukaryotic-like serine/threonine-protein kinase
MVKASPPRHFAVPPGAGVAVGVPMFRGTPSYMSPEHGSLSGPTGASDVYTFGLVLYEMLSGRRALPEKTLRSAMRKVRSQDLTGLAQHLPQPFRGLAKACLSRNPCDRPTMADIERMLARG